MINSFFLSLLLGLQVSQSAHAQKKSQLQINNKTGYVCTVEMYKIGGNYIQPNQRSTFAVIGQGKTKTFSIPRKYYEYNASCGPCVIGNTAAFNMKPPNTKIKHQLTQCKARWSRKQGASLLKGLFHLMRIKWTPELKESLLESTETILLFVPYSAPIKPLFSGRPESALPSWIEVRYDPSATTPRLQIGGKKQRLDSL